jgi:putative ABC transport system permease protein
VRQGLVMAGVGIVVGVAASFAATRLLDEMLFGIGPRDPLTFGVVAALIAIAAVAASAIPAWRAMRVDPLVAMRS